MTDSGTPRRSTGVEILDRVFDGGIPAGSVVSICASPDSQSHLLVTATAEANPTTYFSTYRPPSAVDADADVKSLDVSQLAEDPTRLAASVPQDGAVVVDRLNEIESLGTETLGEALNALAAACAERDAVALLHCLGEEERPERSLSLSRSDLDVHLVRTVTSLSIDHRLVVTKFRGGRAPTEPVKVKLTDHVAVDTSRDIA